MSARHQRLAIVFALVFPTIITLAYFQWLNAWPTAWKQGTYAVGKTLQFAFPAIWIAWVERERLLTRPTLRGFGVGIGFGLLVAAAMAALYLFVFKPFGVFTAAEPAIRAKIVGMGLTSLAAYAALGVFYSLGHSAMEEYYWRWFVFRKLRVQQPLVLAIGVSSLGFMAHHVVVLGAFFGYSSWITWLFCAAIAIGGGIWAWTYDRFSSMTGPWVGHAMVDATIFIIGYDIARSQFV